MAGCTARITEDDVAIALGGVDGAIALGVIDGAIRWLHVGCVEMEFA